MKNNFWVFAALTISLLALVFSINALNVTGGFNKIKTTLLKLEFRMETKKYLLEAKSHLLEAKALYNFKKAADQARSEIQKAEQYLNLAQVTASQTEKKSIDEINQELAKMEQMINRGQQLGSNFADLALGWLDNFFGLVKK